MKNKISFLSKLHSALHLYKIGLKVAFSTELAYRANFIMSSLIMLCFNILFPLVTVLMYQWSSFPGWNIWEVLLIQSIFTIAQGFNSMFFSGIFWQTNERIREGSLEVILLKPVNSLLFMMSSSINPEGIGVMLGGGIMYGFALYHVGITSIAFFVQSVLFFLGGLCVMWSFTMIMSATSFKWVGNSRIPEIFDSLLNFGKYPSRIFPQAIQAIITYIIPVAMIGYYPASALLGKMEISQLLLLIPCVIFCILGMLLYNWMIKLYEGVGG